MKIPLISDDDHRHPLRTSEVEDFLPDHFDNIEARTGGHRVYQNITMDSDCVLRAQDREFVLKD